MAIAATSRTPWNKGRTLPPEPLTPQEALSLLSACSAVAPTGIRNRALLVLLWRGGLRVSEALALMPKDVDPTRGTVRVLRGKGHKARTVGLDPTAMAVIQRWLDCRRDLQIDGRAPLVCTLKGRSLKSSYCRALLPRLARKAGVLKRVHPHGLRHTHAVELARERVPLVVISRQLGHSSAAITNTYINHLNPEEVVETMQARAWPSHDGARSLQETSGAAK